MTMGALPGRTEGLFAPASQVVADILSKKELSSPSPPVTLRHHPRRTVGGSNTIPLDNVPQKQILTDTVDVKDKPWDFDYPQSWAQWIRSETTWHPTGWINWLWDSFSGAFAYVGWSFQDLVNQFHSWDGTIAGLLRNFDLVWRVIVVVFVLWGVTELASVMESVVRVVMVAWEAVRSTFGIAESVIEEMWNLMQIFIEDVQNVARWVTG